jgi:hypothetical protein
VPGQAARVVIHGQDDERKDIARWGHAIASVLRDPAAAFANAEGLRQQMAAKRTWAMAARLVLGATDAQPAGT